MMGVVSVQCYVCSPRHRWMLIYRARVVCVSVRRLLSIDTEFRTLRLRAQDSSGRQHVLTVKLKSKVTFSQLLVVQCKTPQLDADPRPIPTQTGRLRRTQFADSERVISICAAESRSNWRGGAKT